MNDFIEKNVIKGDAAVLSAFYFHSFISIFKKGNIQKSD